MYLQSPNFVFTVPSVYDGIQLDCRIHLPRGLQQPGNAPRWKKQGAIIAHPYAPLGGCCDDPVVSFVGGELLQGGYVVGTFNFRCVPSSFYGVPWNKLISWFRGTGESDGRTSWTARPELGDYVSFYVFMLHYLSFLGLEADSESGSEEIHLILGGYSFGSLIASHLPAVDVIVDLFRNTSGSTTLGAIRQIAREVSALTEEQFSAQAQPPSASPEDNTENTPRPKVSYLLVSPLLPPISLFLTLFSKFSLGVGMETSAGGQQIPCPKPADQLRTYRTLVIYGNEDPFTPASKVRNWSAEIERVPGSRFESHEIDGAGHFWREDGVEAEARRVLREWIGRIP